jgi:hypothetical protein
MSDLIICTKCGVPKEESEYWFDKRRGKVRKPCRDCSRKRDCLTNRLRNENNLISHSDVINHYNAKGLSGEILTFFSDLIILNRSIKKMENPIVKSHGNYIYVFCPICGVYEQAELPCGTVNLIHILDIFTQLHKHHEIKRNRSFKG